VIGSTQHELVIAGLFVLLAGAVWLERTRVGSLVPGPAIMLLGGAILSNIGVMPRESAAYTEVIRIVVPVGVFLLLLRADLWRIIRETGAILRLYLIGAAASIAGVLLAFLLIPVPEATKVAAIQTANLVGGTVNVVAVAQAVGLQPVVFTAMMAGGAIIMNVYVTGIGLLANNGAMQRWLPGREPVEVGEPNPALPAPTPKPAIDRLQIALLVAGSFAAYVACELGLVAIGRPELIIIAVSLVALVVANLAPKQVLRLNGDQELGGLLMYLFFGALGLQVDFRELGGGAAAIGGFIALAMATHLVVMVLVGKLLRASLGEVLIGSLAGVAGPTTAAAMAASLGYKDLITPGLLSGLLGFAIATFVALGLYGVLPG